jgi:hypothetical protein
MPKMAVKALDNYNRKFSIQPTRPLQKDHTDWDKRIKAHVRGESPDDVKIKMNI